MAQGNIASTAVIAYYNAAVECEHLGLWSEAKTNYELALRIAKFINDHHIGHKIVKALQVVNMKVRNKV